MNYTNFVLFALGMLGILIHNLIKLDGINRASNGQVKLGKYWALEKFSILISLCVVAVCLIARNEVEQLEKVGKWLGLAFVTVGYMAQSIVVTFMGRTQKYLDKSNEN